MGTQWVGIMEYLHLLEIRHMDDCEQRMRRPKRVLRLIFPTVEEVVGS
jgi:hypothetical protein